MNWMSMFGRGGASRQDAEEKEAQRQEQDAAEDLFHKTVLGPGMFEEIFAALDEMDDATATRLLGWACFQRRAPDVIRRIGARCTDLSAYPLRGFPALHIAASKGHVSGVKELLSMGADVNRKSGDGELLTALHVAVGGGRLGCVEALLEEAEIEVDSVNAEGYTPLLSCVMPMNSEDEVANDDALPAIAAALIANGADINKKVEVMLPLPASFRTPLLIAIHFEDIDIVKHMLRLGKKPPAELIEAYMNHVGNQGSHDGMFELLVDAGWAPRRARDNSARDTATAGLAALNEALRASQQQRSTGGKSPPLESNLLHAAARNGDGRLAAELLAAGMDPNAVDASGSTALHVAAKEGHDDVVQTLLGAKGIAVDKLGGGKSTALYLAARAEKTGAVRALLKAGASVAEAKSPSGQSILQFVAKRPAGALLEAFIKEGALPASSGQKGYTPLHVACDNIDARGTVEALLRAGELPGHCWNDVLQSPLLVACRRGNLEAVQQLLPKLSLRQVNMSCSAAGGAETPLVGAIKCRDHKRKIAEIVEALLEKGADPNVRAQATNSSALFTALLLKPENGGFPGGIASDPAIGPRVVRALVKAGADVNELSETMGLMPLHLACTDGACPEVIEALLDLGANASAPAMASGFLTPPYLATKVGHLQALRVLIERPGSGGVDAVTASPLYESTYLFLAVRSGQTAVVRYLLEEGADMDLLPKEYEGRSCDESLIEVAAMFGHLDVMNLLIQAKMFKDKAEAEAEAKSETEQQASRED